MSLEEQLLHLIDANLNDRRQVIEVEGNAIDLMRDYSYNQDIRHHLATALNIYEDRRDILPSDFNGLRMLHTKEAVDEYQSKYGIKSFLFDVEIPKAYFNKLMPKVGGKSWYGGLYFPPGKFKGFHHSHLLFSRFGLAIEQAKGRFAHESIHCDRKHYTADCIQRLLPDYDADYPDSRWCSLAEISFAEEILGFMIDDYRQEYAAKSISTNYFESKLDYFSGIYRNLNKEQRAEKRKDFERILMPVKNGIEYAVKFSYSLKEKLPMNMLVPLFFSLGPTNDEISSGKFFSPFADISLWEKCISSGAITQETLKQSLQKKGYCLENS